MTSAPERHMIRLDPKPRLFSMRVAMPAQQRRLFDAADISKETL
ncbi:hypothetical protein [Agrobacterium tumefaciens]|nr:hypothetical protein [Agrobacterium tumefaciens]WCK04489.1 hypothetical protein G6L31_017805 [Agrobacterium tumefaciens]